MLDDMLAAVGHSGVEVLIVSIIGWLGIRLLAWSAGQAGTRVGVAGPCTLVAIWAFAIFANSKTLGRASPVINTVCMSLLILGLLASLVRAAVERHKTRSRRN
jgi:hypothetical protein